MKMCSIMHKNAGKRRDMNVAVAVVRVPKGKNKVLDSPPARGMTNDGMAQGTKGMGQSEFTAHNL